MARPIKSGLDYFPHDTDAVNDEKIASLMAIHGSAGYAFYFIMLEKIFRAENARITCGKPAEKAGFAKLMGITLKKFDSILLTALEVGCFDHETFALSGELTSDAIQRRLITVTSIRIKERKRKEDYKYKIIKQKQNIKPDAENSRKTPVFHAENFFDFESIWSRYPNKDGKKAALAHFKNTVKSEMDFFELQKALENYLASDKVKRGFIKNGSTWFNNWRDWVEPPMNSQQEDVWDLAIKSLNK